MMPSSLRITAVRWVVVGWFGAGAVAGLGCGSAPVEEPDYHRNTNPPANDVSQAAGGAATSRGADAALPGDAAEPSDAGDGASKVDAAAGEPRPPAEAALALWLDPNALVTVVGADVVAWANRSGPATTTLVGATGTVVVDPTSLGSHRALRFAGGKFLEADFGANLGGRPFSIFMVAHAPMSPTAGGFFGTSAFGMLGLGGGGASDTAVLSVAKGGYPGFYVSPAVTALSVKPRVLAFRRKNGVYEVRVDGSTATGTDPAGTLDVYKTLWFASSSVDCPRVFGDILVYDADLTANQVADAETFLKVKYAL